MKQWLKLVNVLQLATTIAFVSAATLATAGTDNDGVLSVRGDGLIMAKPDQVSMTVGITAQAKSANEALAESNKRMRAIIAAMNKLGLNKDNYSTAQFQVHPVWQSRPRNADNNWQASIIAFRVSNSLHVKTQKLKLAGDIVSSAMAAGANQVHGIQFGLADPRSYRQQAIEAAMSNARQDAEYLAAAAGNKITGTVSLELGNTATSPVYAQESQMMRRSAVAMDAGGAPPIESGNVSVRASVSVRYSID